MKVISRRETYGYEISEELKEYGFSGISEGTIYPLLLRLEKNGLVLTEYKNSPVGPKRKYYTISPEGLEFIAQFCGNWKELSDAVNEVLKEGKEHGQENERAEQAE